MFFGNDNENKKYGRMALLGMIQTVFDQNLNPIDWKLKALRKIKKNSKIKITS